MPITLSQLSKASATAEVEYDGEVIHLTYRPAVYTQGNIERMGTDGYGLVEFIVELVSDWDVYSGPKTKPQKVPVTAESLKSLPIGFLRAILVGIMGEAGDEGEPSATSNGG